MVQQNAKERNPLANEVNQEHNQSLVKIVVYASDIEADSLT